MARRVERTARRKDETTNQHEPTRKPRTTLMFFSGWFVLFRGSSIFADLLFAAPGLLCSEQMFTHRLAGGFGVVLAHCAIDVVVLLSGLFEVECAFYGFTLLFK